jgi:hypothetical protein
VKNPSSTKDIHIHGLCQFGGKKEERKDSILETK